MCDSLVAVGAEARDGVTVFGKNSDRQRTECQPLRQHLASWHPPGAQLRCTHVAIPQVAETYRTLGHSPAWVWGYEHGVNEHRVAIGNHTVFSREPIEEEPGLIGMDLVRLGLERGRSARESLEVMAGLIELHGQGGPALGPDAAGYHNSFLLADPQEAWVLETSNRRWAARRTKLGACSNHHFITDDWEIGSRDLESFARSEGWWNENARIDVARAYRNTHVPSRISEGRHRATLEALAAGRGRHDPSTLRGALCDHGEGGAVWTGGDATPEEERFFTVCAHSHPVSWTTASLVAALPRAAGDGARDPWPVWVSFGTPCCGLFLPVYLEGILPAVLASTGDGGAWQTFARLNDAVALDPARRTVAVRDGFSALEAALEQERKRAEAQARSAPDPEAAATRLDAFVHWATDAALSRADEISAALLR